MYKYNGVYNKVITEPAVEPVTTAGFKTFLRIETDVDDSLIADMLKAARISCENYCNRPFINTTFRQVQNNFEFDKNVAYSVQDQLAYRQDKLYLDESQAYIKLQKANLQSVTNITTYNESNSASVYASSNYHVSTASNKIYVNDNSNIPDALRNNEAVHTEYVAGFGASADDVPFAIKHAIYIYTQSIYDFNRDPEQLIAEAYNMPQGAMTLLNPYRLEIGLNG